MICYIPVSVGELYDKYSILMIKEKRIKNQVQLQHVLEEMQFLEKVKNTYDVPNDLFEQLRSCNEQLWEVEDAIRKQEKKQVFDQTFIELARNVYILNDKRAALKKEMNVSVGSKIMEVKSYENY